MAQKALKRAKSGTHEPMCFLVIMKSISAVLFIRLTIHFIAYHENDINFLAVCAPPDLDNINKSIYHEAFKDSKKRGFFISRVCGIDRTQRPN